MRTIKSTEELIAWFEENEKLYLYGAGNLCNKTFCILEELDCCIKIVEILVSSAQENKSEIRGVSVKEYDKNQIQPNIPILVVVSSGYREIICNKLLADIEESRIVVLSDIMEKQMTELIFDNMLNDLNKYVCSISNNNDECEKKT